MPEIGETVQIKSFGRRRDVFITLAAIAFIPSAASLATNVIYPLLPAIDPDETFLWITIHHLLQLTATLGLMLWLGGSDFRKWGFNLENLRNSLIWIAIFAAVWTAIQYSRISGMSGHGLAWPLSSQNMAGVQIFQYGFSGLCEEPLFRGFVITFLALHFKQIYRVFSVEISLPVIFSVLIFMLAHVNIDFTHLANTQIDFDQQMLSLQLGLLYGICFHYTRSLLAPIVMHGLSNGIQFTLLFWLHG